jgi:hypothetical protein
VRALHMRALHSETAWVILAKHCCLTQRSGNLGLIPLRSSAAQKNHSELRESAEGLGLPGFQGMRTTSGRAGGF